MAKKGRVAKKVSCQEVVSRKLAGQSFEYCYNSGFERLVIHPTLTQTYLSTYSPYEHNEDTQMIGHNIFVTLPLCAMILIWYFSQTCGDDNMVYDPFVSWLYNWFKLKKHLRISPIKLLNLYCAEI